ADDVTHPALHVGDRSGRIDDDELRLPAHGVVLLFDAALEQPEAVDGIGRESEVHAGLVELEEGSADEDAGNGDVEGRLEIEGKGGAYGEAVEIPYPRRIAAARDVARIGRVDVAIREHDVAGPKGRKDDLLIAIGEVARVDEAEGGRSQEVLLLGA